MLIQINNLEISVLETDLRGAAAAKLGLKPDAIRSVQILRRSIDARQHRNVRYQYQLAVETGEPVAGEALGISGALAGSVHSDGHRHTATPPHCHTGPAPVIIGAGPAGLFAALAFVECGLRPVIVERGKPAAERKADVDRFWSVGELNPESNMYFGEGGAGTFSDGKLNTRSKNPAVAKILQELVRCGAPEEILYDAKPHVGTDRLLELLPRLRQRLIDAGATFLFNTRMNDLRRTPSGALEVLLNDAWAPAAPLVVACGHSAFDTYRLLLRRGVPMEAKATAIGVRMEHPAEFVTRHFFGKDPRVLAVLGNAPYNLAVPVAGGAASAYSFCCCPGGEVVTCSAVNGLVSVNGMSNSRRDSPFTNAGLVTGVSPEEMLAQVIANSQSQIADGRQEADSRAEITDAKISGVGANTAPISEVLAWREALERRCYELGAVAGPFAIPGQTAFDFVAGRASTRELRTSSRRPVVPSDLAAVLPPQIAERLREGLRAMDQKIPGWIRFGVLLGIETTTSSPVRIVRTPQGSCEGWPELLPVGEGSGYAGGIVTSALDGYEAVRRWADAGRPG